MFTVELDTLLMVRRLLHQAGYGTGETNHDGLHVLMGAEIREATQAADLAVDAARQASGAGCDPSKATGARLAAAAAGKHLAGLRRQFDSKLREDLCKVSEEVCSLNKWTTPFSIIMKPFGLEGLSLVHGQKPDGSTWCTAEYGGTECTGTAPATPDRPTPLIVLGNPTDQAVAARKQHAAVQLPVNTSAASQLRLYALGLSRGGGIYVFGSGAPLAGESRSAAPLELAMRTPVVSTGASPSNQAPVAPSPAAKLRAPAARRHPSQQARVAHQGGKITVFLNGIQYPTAAAAAAARPSRAQQAPGRGSAASSASDVSTGSPQAVSHARAGGPSNATGTPAAGTQPAKPGTPIATPPVALGSCSTLLSHWGMQLIRSPALGFCGYHGLAQQLQCILERASGPGTFFQVLKQWCTSDGLFRTGAQSSTCIEGARTHWSQQPSTAPRARRGLPRGNWFRGEWAKDIARRAFRPVIIIEADATETVAKVGIFMHAPWTQFPQTPTQARRGHRRTQHLWYWSSYNSTAIDVVKQVRLVHPKAICLVHFPSHWDAAGTAGEHAAWDSEAPFDTLLGSPYTSTLHEIDLAATAARESYVLDAATADAVKTAAALAVSDLAKPQAAPDPAAAGQRTIPLLLETVPAAVALGVASAAAAMTDQMGDSTFWVQDTGGNDALVAFGPVRTVCGANPDTHPEGSWLSTTLVAQIIDRICSDTRLRGGLQTRYGLVNPLCASIESDSARLPAAERWAALGAVFSGYCTRRKQDLTEDLSLVNRLLFPRHRTDHHYLISVLREGSGNLSLMQHDSLGTEAGCEHPERALECQHYLALAQALFTWKVGDPDVGLTPAPPVAVQWRVRDPMPKVQLDQHSCGVYAIFDTLRFCAPELGLPRTDSGCSLLRHRILRMLMEVASQVPGYLSQCRHLTKGRLAGWNADDRVTPTPVLDSEHTLWRDNAVDLRYETSELCGSGFFDVASDTDPTVSTPPNPPPLYSRAAELAALKARCAREIAAEVVWKAMTPVTRAELVAVMEAIRDAVGSATTEESTSGSQGFALRAGEVEKRVLEQAGASVHQTLQRLGMARRAVAQHGHLHGLSCRGHNAPIVLLGKDGRPQEPARGRVKTSQALEAADEAGGLAVGRAATCPAQAPHGANRRRAGLACEAQARR